MVPLLIFSNSFSPLVSKSLNIFSADFLPALALAAKKKLFPASHPHQIGKVNVTTKARLSGLDWTARMRAPA